MLYPLSYGRPPNGRSLTRPDDWSRIADPSEVAEISATRATERRITVRDLRKPEARRLVEAYVTADTGR